MAKVRVYVEIENPTETSASMERFRALSTDAVEAVKASESLLDKLANLGLEVASDAPPVPMYSDNVVFHERHGFHTFATTELNPDVSASSYVVLCETKASEIEKLKKKPGVAVFAYQDPELFVGACGCGAGVEVNDAPSEDMDLFDLANSSGGVDCRPHRPGATVSAIRSLLGVRRAWSDGFTGQNVVVGIVDEGVNSRYPVIGGMTRPGAFAPGSAPITSHGSMCAADVLVAAPSARLLDYPIFDTSGRGMDSLPVWMTILDQRRRDGTPHLTNNSYGFTALFPGSPATDPNHPINRAIRQVVATGIPCFFAAGNCGSPCPANCRLPLQINGSNSLAEVITVAAVNSRRERIGYSSQGPGNLLSQKPDIASYSHLFGNFGPGRPGGTVFPFDSGTSAACPVACGVGALLLSAFPRLTPAQMANVLRQTAINIGQPGFDHDTGHGVISAGVAYHALATSPLAPSFVEQLRLDEPSAASVAEAAPRAANRRRASR